MYYQNDVGLPDGTPPRGGLSNAALAAASGLPSDHGIQREIPVAVRFRLRL
jgi:hypothetical protein